MTPVIAPMSLSRLPLIDRDPWLIRKASGRKVLHLGPTDNYLTVARANIGFLLHQKLGAVAAQLLGVILDEAGIRALREKFEITNIIHGDIERLADAIPPGRKFDVIIAADVIEHVNNPGLFLSGAQEFLDTDGELILTVSNAFSLKKFLAVAFFRQERNHPDHVCFYSRMNLRQLLGRFGFDICEEYAFLIRSHNGRKVNVYANIIASGIMKLLGNNNIADEWAIVARTDAAKH